MENKSFDSWLIVIFLFLVSFGILLIYSSTYSFSLAKTGDSYFLFKRHMGAVVVGVLLTAFFALFPIEKIRKYIPALVIGTIILLLLALLPVIGKKEGGAYRWVNFVFFSFQPSEIAKLVIVFYLASILEKKQKYIKNYFKGTLGPFIICSIFSGIILFQKDFSTSVFLLLIVFSMIYVGGGKLINLLVSFAVTVPILTPFILTSGYRLDRIKMLFNIDSDPNASYQLIQSLEAFKRGGFFKLDFGKGLKTIPYVFNDFIYCVAGEEMGFVGALMILLLFLFLWQRGMGIARLYPERSFKSNLAFGITFFIVVQAFLNMAVSLALIFPTGITLPFISYGRSSFIISCIAMGILIQLSRKKSFQST